MTQVKQIVPTTSFLQEHAHGTKSERFVAIQPVQIKEVLQDYGFNFVSLKTGQARKADRADHQTTIARYRQNTELKINGLFMDLVFKIPHLYGSIQSFLGTYRQVCSNGLVVGHKFFEAKRIRHTDDAQQQINDLMPKLIARHDDLVEQIEVMQSRNVTPEEIATLTREVAHLRLGQDVQNVRYGDLIRVRRVEDQGTDLFSVLNILQENVMRHGLRYQTVSTDDAGQRTVRNMPARPIVGRDSQGDIETIRSVDLNAQIWNAAAKLLEVK